jgi:hypothetical protein
LTTICSDSRTHHELVECDFRSRQQEKKTAVVDQVQSFGSPFPFLFFLDQQQMTLQQRKIDLGKEKSVFDGIRNCFAEIAAHPTPSTRPAKHFYELLPFQHTGHMMVNEGELRAAVERLLAAPNFEDVRMLALIQYVHLTNAIENEAPSTVEETQQILTTAGDFPNGPAIRSTYNAVKAVDEVPPGCHHLNHVLEHLTVQGMCRMHKLILAHEPQANLGKFRTCGVQVIDLDGCVRIYPNHLYVPGAVEDLCTIFRYLLTLWDTCSDIPRLSGLFSIAAALQFYFVTIHPFHDGNGRMCRLLSKMVLDIELPITIPMFRSKHHYLRAIMDGQHGNIGQVVAGVAVPAVVHEMTSVFAASAQPRSDSWVKMLTPHRLWCFLLDEASNYIMNRRTITRYQFASLDDLKTRLQETEHESAQILYLAQDMLKYVGYRSEDFPFGSGTLRLEYRPHRLVVQSVPGVIPTASPPSLVLRGEEPVLDDDML